jgi:flagellin
MGLRIRTNVASLKAQRGLSETQNASTESMEKLSSGYRINKSADDAAGLAISEQLRANVRSMSQAKRNAADGISFIQVAEGSMNEISNILVRLRELSVQTASDSVGNLERSYANKEYIQLVDEIDRISNSAEYNGFNLLGGADGNSGLSEVVFHIGKGNASVPNTDTISVNIEDFKINSGEILGLGKEAEIGPMDGTSEFERGTAAAKLGIIDSAIKRVAGNRATLGAKQSRLGSTINNLEISIENAQSSNSRIRDVDFAAETANFTQQRILSQAGVAVLSNANSAPEMALSLLR